MLNYDGNENSKEKKTTTTFVISELRGFRLIEHGGGGEGGGGRVLNKVLYWQTPP